MAEWLNVPFEIPSIFICHVHRLSRSRPIRRSIDRLRIKMEIRQYIDKSVIDWKWKNSSSIIGNHSTRRNWNEKIDSKNYGKIDLNNRFLVLSSHFILNIFEYINIHLWVWIELHRNLYSHHTNSYGFQKLKEIEKIRTSLKVWKNVSNFAW